MSLVVRHIGPSILAVSLFAVTNSTACGQGRSMHQSPFMMPTMMGMPTRFTTPMVTPSTMPMRFPMTSVMGTNLTTNSLLQRDVRLDALLLRDMRFDPFLRRTGLSSMMGFGAFGPQGFFSPLVVPVGGSLVGPSGGGIPATATGDAARAALAQEQAIAERLANRRRAFDEMVYERDRTPTPEQEQLARSRANPPLAEVVSGQALNSLLADLRQLGNAIDEMDQPDALLPLDRRGLKHINVTRGAGNIALLKGDGRLTWPAALAEPVFQEPRERIAALAPQAVRQARASGRVDPAAIRQLTEDVGQMRALLRQQAANLSFQPFAEAKSFLQGLDAAVVALQQPDVIRHFNGGYDLRAQTVLGLVKQMSDEGLRFAPAAPGDEAAYTALREALASCDRVALKLKTAAR
jgi:hypothetical protein